jgi:hypothetical protein
MSDQAHNKRPLRPPGLDPQSPGANPPPQYKDDFDERTWHYGIIASHGHLRGGSDGRCHLGRERRS